MSGLRGRKARSRAVPADVAAKIELWWRAVALRAEWQRHILRTGPADRKATEEAIAGLYALLGEPRPRFVWVDSPAAAMRLLPPPPTLRLGGPWPVESRIATLASTLRRRLDWYTGGHREPWMNTAGPPADPLSALRSGTTIQSLVDEGIGDVLRRVARESVAGVLRAELPERLGLVWYGQHEADLVARYEASRLLHGNPLPAADAEQLELWATIARSGGWWWPRGDRCVIAERPAAVHTEPLPGTAYDEVRLHHADGPSVVFPDGWAVHAWHGTWVPSWVIEAPTVRRITSERNAEVRRCAIERIGWQAFIDRAGLTLIGRTADPGNPGCDLSLYDLPRHRGVTPARLLHVVNGSVERDGTRRQYGLHVPPWFDDPIDAAGWSYGLSGAQYSLLRRRT
ncbi:DUF6745 domain-containing protein [Amycolatopsis aidingensis]|uniref:DUF6745 domain-containing protein n=1 Tax=Amycolatopsis aidingensis TaxID=2842453 RepID=UPI001C0BA1C6|nr:hypothetical protein [Amycolatopsis aidingensis]